MPTGYIECKLPIIFPKFHIICHIKFILMLVPAVVGCKAATRRGVDTGKAKGAVALHKFPDPLPFLSSYSHGQPIAITIVYYIFFIFLNKK